MGKVTKLDLFFGGLLVGFSIYFVIWGFGFIQGGNKTIFILSALFGIFMAFNIGGNDVANSFGTSVGAKTLSLRQALCVAAIFEVSGAVLAGADVTETIKSGIIDLNGINLSPFDFIFIMMSSLISAGLWILFATKKGLPVSTTHAIIGGIVGAGMTLGVILNNPEITPASLVKWSKIWEIVLSWITSPLLGGIVSFLVYGAIKKYILDYNEKAQKKINELKVEKKAYKKAYKLKFEKLSENEKININQTMLQDFDLIS